MTHRDIQDLLEDFVDERLDRPTRKSVSDHLAHCDECRAVLDGVAPVDLGPLADGAWDERAMRRAVRRSILRTALNTAGLLLVAWLIVTTVSALVAQPLLVNRNGRATAATVATVDLAVLFNPGTAVDDYEFDSGLLSRRSSAHVVMPVGTDLVDGGSLATRITLTGFGADSGGRVSPFLGHQRGGGAGLDEHLQAIGDNTVATVELFFDDPLDIEDAQRLADAPHDVRVVWAGFALDSPDAAPLQNAAGPAGLGYGTCGASLIDPDSLGSGGGGGSSSVFDLPPSIEGARTETLRALDNLVEHGELIESLFDPGLTEEVFAAAAREIAEQGRVASLVVTGPAPDLREFIASAGPDFGAVRQVDFTNWFTPLCGR